MCRFFEFRSALSPIFVGIERLSVEGSVEEQVQFAINYGIGFRIDGKFHSLGTYTPSTIAIKLGQITAGRFGKGVLIGLAGKIIGCPVVLGRMGLGPFLGRSGEIPKTLGIIHPRIRRL